MNKFLRVFIAPAGTPNGKDAFQRVPKIVGRTARCAVRFGVLGVLAVKFLFGKHPANFIVPCRLLGQPDI